MSNNQSGFQKNVDEFLKQLEVKKLEFDVFVEEAQLKKVQLELDIEKIQEEKAVLQKVVTQLSDKKALLRADLDNTLKVKQDCKQEAMGLAEAIDFQKHDLTTLKNDIAIAEKTKEQLAILIESMEDENCSLIKQTDLLRDKVEVLKKHVQALGQEETALETVKVKLDREIVEKNGEINQLEQEINKLGEERQHESLMIKKYQDNCASVQQEFQRKTKEKEGVQQELNRLAQQEIEVQGRLDNLLANIQQTQKKFEMAEERVRIKKDEYHVVVSDIDQEKEGVEAYRQEAKKEVEALLENKRAILIDLKELKEKMVSANEEWKDLKLSLCYDQEKVEQLAEENRNLEMVRSNLFGRIEEAEISLKKMNERERELLSLLDQKYAQLEIFKEQYERGQEKCRAMEEKYTETCEKLKAADSLFVTLEDKIKTSKEQLRSTRNDLIVAKREKVECHANVRNFQQEGQKLQKKQTEIQNNIVLMQKEERILGEKLQKKHKTSASLVSRIDARRKLARELNELIESSEVKNTRLQSETRDLEELKNERIALKDQLFKEYSKLKQFAGEKYELRRELESLGPSKIKLDEVKYSVKMLNKQLGKLISQKRSEEKQIDSFQEKIKLLKIELEELGGYRKEKLKEKKIAEKQLLQKQKRLKQQRRQALKVVPSQKTQAFHQLYESLNQQRKSIAVHWPKIAAATACVLVLALSPLWFPRIFSDAKREIASVKSVSFKGAYIKDDKALDSYVKYMASEALLSLWKRQLTSFLGENMALGANEANALVALELSMISELKKIRENKIISESGNLTKEMLQIEKDHILQIKAIFNNDKKYMQFRAFQKNFFKEHL